MINYSQLLADKTDTIVDRWIEAVRQDRKIETSDDLSPMALRNHIPHVLQAMATVLSQSQHNDIQLLADASLEHGVLRAEQGFNPTEIAREYRLLRWEIFNALEVDLLQGTVAEVIRVFRLIDVVVDIAIAQCFKSYVDQRLQELEQLQHQLQLTNQELTRLVRANQENFSHLAHELKTPLNSIIGYSELFLRQQRQPSEVRDSLPSIENVERVLRNGRQLLRLINDALELARYEAGKMPLHPMPTDIRSVIRNVIEIMEPLAESSGLQLIINCDLAPKQVLTDPLRLQQIVTNLISNAIRYTESGSIQLKCEILAHEQWTIAISDTGIGIPVEAQAQIFDPFFQVGVNDRCRFPDSTGLGLAIVSRLVKLLQGRLELVSRVGSGSTFTVILPLEVKISESVMTATS
jgi:hypothetical protein